MKALKVIDKNVLQKLLNKGAVWMNTGMGLVEIKEIFPITGNLKTSKGFVKGEYPLTVLI